MCSFVSHIEYIKNLLFPVFDYLLSYCVSIFCGLSATTVYKNICGMSVLLGLCVDGLRLCGGWQKPLQTAAWYSVLAIIGY